MIKLYYTYMYVYGGRRKFQSWEAADDRTVEMRERSQETIIECNFTENATVNTRDGYMQRNY